MLDFLHENIFSVDCDLLVIPISTEGTISNSFKEGLKNLFFSDDLWENRLLQLGDISIVKLQSLEKEMYIAFACSVDRNSSSYYAIRLIGKTLAGMLKDLKDVKKIATPLLGTGAGGLNPDYSLNIMRAAFYEASDSISSKLIFCTPDKALYESFKRVIWNIDIPSAQLVIEAEISKIRENEQVEKMLFEKDFYFELAKQKFEQYLYFKPRQKNFYNKLATKFEDSGITFKAFLEQKLTSEQDSFTTLCGELIAYIDYHAYRKNIWNKYPDKRILARSAVRQHNWFLNLIKYKQTESLNMLSPSIRNAFIYLESPEVNLTILSDEHRRKVFEKVFFVKYTGAESIEILLKYVNRLGFRPLNAKNLGALCSRILYLPFIRPVWDDTNKWKLKTHEENLDLSDVSYLIEMCLKTNSKSLDLGNCGLTDLSLIPELFECTHLEKLILSNEWSEYSNGKWKKVKSENKGKKNSIIHIPNEIGNLRELKILICGGDWNNSVHQMKRWEISDITGLTKLNKLEYLNLSNNKLKSIKGLSKISNLKIAHLNNNNILEVEDLNNLIFLEELYLSNNEIMDVAFINQLKRINTIDFHSNNIKDLSSISQLIERIGIKNSKWEVGTLNIANNSLEKPPMEIVNLGKEAVLGVFKDIEEGGMYINKDIKVILVGNSEVGKSTLVKYLDKENDLDKEHLPTVWMDEKTVKSKYKIDAIGEECWLHIFDFGGHDYFHDTHHMFYSANTIYVLLWDEETNKLNLRKTYQKTQDGLEQEIETQDFPIKYWLDSVRFHTKNVEAENFEFEIKGGDTYNSSLLLIQNKVAKASEIKPLNNEKLKKKYPFIHDIINISIKEPKRNLGHFDTLFLEMLNRMNIIGAVLPEFYRNIKDSISIYSGEPILTISEFIIYCNTKLQSPITLDQGRILVKYLDQTGFLIYSNKNADEKVFIDKPWIIKCMHKILSSLLDKKGEFNRKYVEDTLSIKDNRIDDILSVMQEFKMIFRHPYAPETFIAPLYLPKLPDGKINLFLSEKIIQYRRFEYNGFIHKSIILSIFQKFGSLIPHDKKVDTYYYYWRDGLVVKNPVTEEIVMIKFLLGNEHGFACIDIFELKETDKHIFSQEIIEYIRDANKGFDLEEMVTLDGVDFISKAILEKNANIGKFLFSQKKLSEPEHENLQKKHFKLKDYMQFIDNKINKKKVVISYSKYDIEHVHTLVRYLRPLVDWDLIDEPWWCETLITSEPWDDKIRFEFNNADIIFFMVSANLFSTKYVIENEIKDAIERYDKDNSSVKIVPIVLEYYDWGRKNPINLQRFSAMPFKGKPISDYMSSDIPWHMITQAVRIMIEKDISPEKNGTPNREIQDIYERQVKGRLDNNSL